MDFKKGVTYRLTHGKWEPHFTEEQMAAMKQEAALAVMNETFDPTIRTEPDELDLAYRAAREVVQSRAKMSQEAKDFATAIMPTSIQAARVARKAMLNLKRAIRLRDKFGWKVVRIDEKTQRRAKPASGREHFDIPLVWRARIPAPAKVSISVNGYTISTKTPPPTPEAEKVCRDHKHRFSWLEVAWVPKDENLFAHPIPKPDPVVVGVLDLGNGRCVCLELTRWVDESVESAYWAKEGY